MTRTRIALPANRLPYRVQVTVDASGLCPTPYGSRIDPGCGALAESLGFWEPWRKPINADF